MDKEQEFIMKPKVDYCFKELMQEACVRNGFISALLALRPEEIQKTELMPTHLRQMYGEDKLGILDVRVLMSDGTQLDIEIQVAPFLAWPERSLFYLSKIFSGQLKVGEPYEGMKKCIHVGILDFELFGEDEEFYSRFHLWEDSRNRLYTDKFEIHILELPKLRKHDYPESDLLYWEKFFNAERKEEFEAMSEKNEMIDKAFEKLLNMSADDLKKQEYEERQKAIRDHEYLMRYNRREGISEGETRKLISMVRKKIKKGKLTEMIAEELEEELKTILPIYELLSRYPEETDEEIYQRLNRQDNH